MAALARLVLSLALIAGGSAAAGDGGPSAGTWDWPVVGPVIRPFDPPENPYSSGHRGIDVAAAFGTIIRAPAPGVVTFAGQVAGELFITLDHGDGYVSTYSWVSAILVGTGDAVALGAAIGLTGVGHPGSLTAHLHLGVKLNDAYVDPLLVLGPPPVSSLIHLAPIAL